MPFEVFTKQLAAQAGSAMVTIQRRGIFALNESAYQALGAPDALLFLFDRDRQVVGLVAAHPDDDNAYRVRTTKNHGGTHIVTGSRFARHYDIPTDRGRRYLANLDGDILAFDISGKEVSVGVSDEEDPDDEGDT